MKTVAALKTSILATLGAAAFLTLTACGDGSTQTSETSIYGGSKVASGAMLNTVALTAGGQVFCTGTAITPTVVITAAHCAQAVPDARYVSVYVGGGAEGGNVRGQYPVSKFKASPSYSYNGNDIAYAVLSKPLDLPASAFIPVLTDATERAELLKTGAPARIVGFGGRNGGGYGVKFSVDTTVRQVGRNEIAIGGSGKDSCQGDSGGPAFGQLANGEWRVYGVVSRGGACGSGGIYGLMHANICWVQKDSGVDLGLAEGSCGTAAAVL